MNSITHLLEDFTAQAGATPLNLTDVSLEEERLAAFDKGYQAGWDDSVHAQAEDRRHITAEFAQNLRDINFTYEEVRGALLNGLQPLLQDIVAVVLPPLARHSLAPRIAAILHERLAQAAAQPIELRVSPDDYPSLTALLEEQTDADISIAEDPDVGPGQVQMRIGAEEQAIDMSAVIEGVQAALSGFFEENQRKTA